MFLHRDVVVRTCKTYKDMMVGRSPSILRGFYRILVLRPKLYTTRAYMMALWYSGARLSSLKTGRLEGDPTELLIRGLYRGCMGFLLKGY